jgi:hypothetical protein
LTGKIDAYVQQPLAKKCQNCSHLLKQEIQPHILMNFMPFLCDLHS